MATDTQSKYIADLVVKKTKEFKEAKEMLIASGIVGENAELVANAESIAEITHALDDSQASRYIDILIATKDPARSSTYSQKRVEKTVGLLDDIKSTISNWGFN